MKQIKIPLFTTIVMFFITYVNANTVNMVPIINYLLSDTSYNTTPVGILDNTFDSDGIVIHNNAAGGNGSDVGKAITHDSEGNVYVAGYSAYSGYTPTMIIWKYKSDGVLDSTFGTNGIVAVGGNAQGFDITLDRLGNIYVTGFRSNGTDSDMAIWKYKSDGVLDSTFGTNGIVVYDSGYGNDMGMSITLDSSGNIYVSGTSKNSVSPHGDMTIYKYDSNGSLDSTFGTNGVVLYNGPYGYYSRDEGRSIALDNLGNIYVTGYSVDEDPSVLNAEIVTWKYESDGSLDNTFGTNGIATYKNSSDSSDWGKSIILDDSGNIYVTGSSENGVNGYDMIILKYTSDGDLDIPFGMDGIVIHNNAAGGNGMDSGADITLDMTGNLYVAGLSYRSYEDRDMAIWKYKSDGVLDSTFGTNGIVVYDEGFEAANAMTLDDSGNIYVTGSISSDMIIWKYK